MNIGVDLCDDYITVYCAEEKSMISVPAVICREKKEDVWYIGETAYRTALSGSGVLTDKLLSLLKKNGTSTISRKAYTAGQLIARLLSTVLSQILNGSPISDIENITIALRDADRQEMDGILEAAVMAGMERDRIHMISHQEAFIHYVMAQDKELSYNMAGLFDLSGEDLSFCSLKVIRGGGKNSIAASGGELEEKFRTGILKNDSGSELADRIMTEAAKKYLGNGIYSSVFLTGKGFERTDWAKGFIEFVCKKRRVMYEAGLFAIGAAYFSAGQSADSAGYRIFCDTRTPAEVSLQVMINDRKSKLVMIPAGVPWYTADAFAEVLLKGQTKVDIDIEAPGRVSSKKSVSIPLEGFPARPDRCTRVSVRVRCEDGERLNVSIRDMGFGEIYPAEDVSVSRQIAL